MAVKDRIVYDANTCFQEQKQFIVRLVQTAPCALLTLPQIMVFKYIVSFKK